MITCSMDVSIIIISNLNSVPYFTMLIKFKKLSNEITQWYSYHSDIFLMQIYYLKCYQIM